MSFYLIEASFNIVNILRFWKINFHLHSEATLKLKQIRESDSFNRIFWVTEISLNTVNTVKS